jgi:hypothetical protein
MANRMSCANCGAVITGEPFGAKLPQRLPCPTCSGLARVYEMGVVDTIGPLGDDVAVPAPPGEAVATMPEPTIGTTDKAPPLFEVTRQVTWSRTPDMWLVEIRKADGDILAVEVGEHAREVLALLDDFLVPPTE